MRTRVYKGVGTLSAGTLSHETRYLVTRAMFGVSKADHVRPSPGKEGGQTEQIGIRFPGLGLPQAQRFEAAKSVVLRLKGGSRLPIAMNGTAAMMTGDAQWSDDEEYEER